MLARFAKASSAAFAESFPVPPMYRDLQRQRSVEVDHILGDLLARARHLGVPAPLLAAAFTHLRVYQQRLAAS
jgi:2-dehydropantoate 2-reductase